MANTKKTPAPVATKKPGRPKASAVPQETKVPDEYKKAGEEIKIPVADIEISDKFAQALETYKATLSSESTINVMTDGFPQIEVISFDKSIPNSQFHVQSLRKILTENNNSYGTHRRFVGTQEELIKQLEGVEA